MRKLLSSFLIVLNLMLVGCIVGALLQGCTEQQLTPQPKFYSPTEKNIMMIPKGCKIGDIVAPEDGIFIGKSRIIDMRIIEVPQKDVPDKQKKKRA